MPKCKICSTKADKESLQQVGLALVCRTDACIAGERLKLFNKQQKKRVAAVKAEAVEFNRETKRRRDKALTRAELYAKLQKLVNQWVLHVRDKDEPCCTCGTTKPVKYDAGHYLAAGRMPELRFELTNIHRQCSQLCNLHGSGKRGEYDPFIVAKYGQDHFDWLNGPHKPLKDTFPHTDDIRAEIDRYRVIIREAGLKPRV